MNRLVAACRVCVSRLVAARLVADQRGAMAVLFGLSALPLIAMVGLAVDYSYYVQARSQLNLAVDAAAMQAVRTATQAYASGSTAAQSANVGQTAGAQWFAAQFASKNYLINVDAGAVAVTVIQTTSPSGFSATVTASGTATPVFGNLFKVASYPLASTSNAVVSNSFVEVLLLMDNSPSMLIGATVNDMYTMEEATICSTQAAGTAYNGYFVAAMNLYIWNNASQSCPGYDGSATLCFNPNSTTANPMGQTLPLYRNYNRSGQCVNAAGQLYGGGSVNFVPNTPAAPCAFACHDDPNNNDYYGLARQLGVTLRLDLVEQAAANVIRTLQTNQQTPGQFLVGVYQFNSTTNRVYPTSGTAEAGTNLASALTLTQNTVSTPPLTLAVPDTYFSQSVSNMINNTPITPAGNGSSASAPTKNIFIVTDGLNDTSVNGQTLAPVTSATNEAVCQKFKNLGFSVYVLYTQYLPIPVGTWVDYPMPPIAEPATNSAITQALQACSGPPNGTTSNAYFLQVNANDATSINTAMQTLLQNALNSSARVTN